MSSPKKFVGTYLSPPVVARLKAHCAARGYIRSAFIERALTKALDEDGATKKPPTEEES